MKVRIGFVSNSSSSSFVIAYDPNFFGDLRKRFEEGWWGCETEVEKEAVFCLGTPDALAEGKTIIQVDLDREYRDVIKVLKQINEQNGGDKLTVLYDEEDELQDN